VCYFGCHVANLLTLYHSGVLLTLLLLTFIVWKVQSRGSSVSAVSRMWAARTELHQRQEVFCSANFPVWSWSQGHFILRSSDRNVKLTTHIHPVPCARINGVIARLPPERSRPVEGRINVFFVVKCRYMNDGGHVHVRLSPEWVCLLMYCTVCRSVSRSHRNAPLICSGSVPKEHHECRQAGLLQQYHMCSLCYVMLMCHKCHVI
jgi:hypothetical protein